MKKRRRKVTLNCGCVVELIIPLCEHYLIDLDHCPLKQTEEWKQALREEREAAERAREESYQRSIAPLGSSRHFSVLKGGPNRRIQRGYDIRVWRYDRQHNLDYEMFHAWGIDEQLPDEWYALQRDPTIEKADIARNSERSKWVSQRRFLEKYSRS
jgi:hypothetical protein